MAISFKKLHWTEHSKLKMRQYALSKTKLLAILRNPERKELGIVPGTTAVMQTNKKYPKNKEILLFKNKWQGHYALSIGSWRKAPGEIWLMYKDVTLRRGSGQERKIISAWRYPGVSKPGEEIPIPEDIRQEILKEEA